MNNKSNEIVGVFSGLKAMEDAINKLEVSGFSRLDITVLGSKHALKVAFGKNMPSVKQMEDDNKTPRSANIAGEGLGIAQGVIIGLGLLIGVVAVVGGIGAKILGAKYAVFFQQQIDSGGLLLWVRTKNISDEEKASAIYKEHGASDVHMRGIAL